MSAAPTAPTPATRPAGGTAAPRAAIAFDRVTKRYRLLVAAGAVWAGLRWLTFERYLA